MKRLIMKMRKVYATLLVIVVMCFMPACNSNVDNSEVNSSVGDGRNDMINTNVDDSRDENVSSKEENIMDNENQTSVTMVVPEDDEYVKIKDYIPDIYVELRYATENNFTKNVIYEFDDAYLRYGTVKKLAEVQKELMAKGYSLKIWDAYRPFSAQKRLWEVYPDARYVANPKYGMQSHNLGNTVDSTLVKSDGEQIPMPTDFDDFSKKADRNYNDIENTEAVENVLILQGAMIEGGFVGYEEEWWDYSDTREYDAVEYEILAKD